MAKNKLSNDKKMDAMRIIFSILAKEEVASIAIETITKETNLKGTIITNIRVDIGLKV